jgi:hypothetical protein
MYMGCVLWCIFVYQFYWVYKYVWWDAIVAYGHS